MPLIATRGAASAQGFGEFAQSAAPVYIEDVYSTYLYTGNGSTQTITNNIDFSTKGGLVWTKIRSGANDHILVDTVRGTSAGYLATNQNFAQSGSTYGVTSFGTTGYTLNSAAAVNQSSSTFASWTFRRQPKFFDIQTYAGSASAVTINHNLGSTPGCVIIKSTDTARNWMVWHRSLTTSQYLYLNTTDNVATLSNWISVSSTQITIQPNASGNPDANFAGRNYIAYIFAHNAGGFGLTGTDNVITCGTYLGSNHRNKEIVTLGYEPQWVFIKNITTAGNRWVMVDNMRSMADTGSQAWLAANSSAAETTATVDQVVAASTGFYFNGPESDINEAGSTFIYIAIRRGPMKVPTSGTTVFKPITYVGNGSTNSITGMGFPPDLLFGTPRNFNYSYFVNKLVGIRRFMTATNASAETATLAGEDFTTFDQDGFSVGVPSQTAWNNNGTNSVMWNFRRAPGFFDIVCYTGTGNTTTQALTHNLTVAPELIINKPRNVGNGWTVWSSGLGGNDKWLGLELNAATQTSSLVWNNTAPTTTTFTVGQSNQTNGLGTTYVTYLFATVAGVSKVGSYTGTGTTQVINCGFTAGSRFVMIKRTDSTGDWYVWDSARGIVAGNDPYLLVNSTAAEVTGTDYVDTANSGFEISSTAPAAINANGGTFIFLAVA